jgi:hypothetical protein
MGFLRKMSLVDRVARRYLDRSAAKGTDQLLKELVKLAETAKKLEKELEAKVNEARALEKERKLGPTPHGRLVSGELEGLLFSLRKGHFDTVEKHSQAALDHKIFAKFR